MQFLRWYVAVLALNLLVWYGFGVYSDGVIGDEAVLEAAAKTPGKGFRVFRNPPDGSTVTVNRDEWVCTLEPTCRSRSPETFVTMPFNVAEPKGWKCLERGGCAPTAKDAPYSDPAPAPAGTSI